MVNLVDDTTDRYEQYAQYCLRLAAQSPDRDSRVMLREMAAEWLKLCDAAAPGSFDGFRQGVPPDARG
jgi:hypothetical protein